MKKFAQCLVIDDDHDVLLSVRLLLREYFEEVKTFADPRSALQSMEQSLPDAILLDANFAQGAINSAEGMHWLEEILKRDPQAAVVMVTAYAGIQIAVSAMKRGATDFVAKPWSNDRLLATVRNAVMVRASRQKAVKSASENTSGSALIGSSPAMARVLSLIAKSAPTDANVLILGENGTGKELVAREVHRLSLRANNPFISLDVGAVVETLFESELFGHIKGAFTEARNDRVGRMPAANGGTLFLDEIGNLPRHLQPKLLTALEQRQVVPVGSNNPVGINVRLVAATNLPRKQLTDQSQFRPDLLYRINTVEIEIPPLRERREDIIPLTEHYLALYSRQYNKPARPLTTELTQALFAHDWPGNVRALRHAVERAVILAEGAEFGVEDFLLVRANETVAQIPVLGARDNLNLDCVEKETVEEALRKNAYNISQAATDLGLSRGALYRRMEKHGI